MDSLHRIMVLAMGLSAGAIAGCLQIPFCVPELNYAPSVAAKGKLDEVHVFRVDLTQKSDLKDGGAQAKGDVVETHELTRLRPDSNGVTPTQIGVSFSSGWRVVGLANFTSSSVNHAISLRFYRRGYQTIVVKPGDNVRELDWKVAGDLSAEVAAVDELMRGPLLQQSRSITVKQVLAPGSASRSHKEALLFGAAEYERLARDLSPSHSLENEMRERVLTKANRLRSLAGQKKDG